MRFLSSENKASILMRFFKCGKGEYGEGDIFLGVNVPEIRAITKEYSSMSLEESIKLLNSPEHEFRLCALLIWVYQSKKAMMAEDIYNAYIENLARVNNWDLVDQSAPQIVGGYIINKDRSILYKLIDSNCLWKQRVALVATLHLIRNGEFDDTIELCKRVIDHKHDLIHKASGWMLREMGKREEPKLLSFLDEYAGIMPRTMLRYSIEKLSPDVRKLYMDQKRRTNNEWNHMQG
ncbi:MAG: DNA alkylation repair protein [Bacteroidales bacterium]